MLICGKKIGLMFFGKFRWSLVPLDCFLSLCLAWAFYWKLSLTAFVVISGLPECITYCLNTAAAWFLLYAPCHTHLRTVNRPCALALNPFLLPCWDCPAGVTKYSIVSPSNLQEEQYCVSFMSSWWLNYVSEAFLLFVQYLVFEISKKRSFKI